MCVKVAISRLRVISDTKRAELKVKSYGLDYALNINCSVVQVPINN